MDPIALFRVRWWKPTGLTQLEPGANARELALDHVGNDRSRAVTVEIENGDGPVAFVVLGGAGVVDENDALALDANVIMRTWVVEGAEEIEGSLAEPGFLLGEYCMEADSYFGDLEQPRLLAAEEVATDGDEIVVWAVRWWDPKEWAEMFEDDFDDE